MVKPSNTTGYDLLIENARIITGGKASREIPRGRIGIIRDRISLLESSNDGPPPSAVRTIDADGLLAIPGLINTHTHAVLCLMRGVAEDMGFAPAYTKGVPQSHMITPDEAVALARLGALEALKFGSTLLCDTYVHPGHTLPAMGELGMRIVGCNLLHDVDFAGMPHGRWNYEDAIGDRQLAELLDVAERHHGALDGRLRVQMAPHAPDTCSRAFLSRLRAVNDTLNLTCSIHLAQSRTEVERIRERDGMTPVELLDAVGFLDSRLLAAHCIHMTDQDIRRCGEAGINVAHVPKGNAGGGMMAPTRRLHEAGANLTLATDNLLGDMVEMLRWALCIGRLQTGSVDQDWQPEDVFRMATTNGARALGMQDELGTLGLGRKADVVLMDMNKPHFVPRLNTLGNLVHCGQGSNVHHVLVDGRMVVQGGTAVHADEEGIMRDAQLAATAIWDRAR